MASKLFHPRVGIAEGIYWKTDAGGGRLYHFEGLALLDMTVCLDDHLPVRNLIITASDKYTQLPEADIRHISTIKDFNLYFINKRNYIIREASVILQNGMQLYSRNDHELSIYTREPGDDRQWLNNVFLSNGLSKSLLDTILQKPGYFFSIDRSGEISSLLRASDSFTGILPPGTMMYSA